MPTEISASSIEALHRIALRYADSPDEADDLVQDMLLAALEQPRVWDGGDFQAWVGGVFRRRALFVARTEWRRRRREDSYAVDAGSSPDSSRRLPRDFIETLPPSLQTVALLANIGLGRTEIGGLLGIADTALRQRVSALRRAWRSFGGDPEVEEIPRGYPPLCGLRRRSLRASLAQLPGARFAVADPDGHEILFATAHNSPARGNQERKRVAQKTH